jgi:hypothetical protein
VLPRGRWAHTAEAQEHARDFQFPSGQVAASVKGGIGLQRWRRGLPTPGGGDGWLQEQALLGFPRRGALLSRDGPAGRGRGPGRSGKRAGLRGGGLGHSAGGLASGSHELG